MQRTMQISDICVHGNIGEMDALTRMFHTLMEDRLGSWIDVTEFGRLESVENVQSKGHPADPREQIEDLHVKDILY